MSYWVQVACLYLGYAKYKEYSKDIYRAIIYKKWINNHKLLHNFKRSVTDYFNVHIITIILCKNLLILGEVYATQFFQVSSLSANITILLNAIRKYPSKEIRALNRYQNAINEIEILLNDIISELAKPSEPISIPKPVVDNTVIDAAVDDYCKVQ